MPIRESLPPVLRGEVAADLSPESRALLDRMAEEAAAEGMAAWLRDECAGRLRQPNASRGISYLLARACAANGEVERAHQTFLVLGEALAAAREWEPLAAVAEDALALEESGAAARLLVRAHEGLAQEPARVAALERAHGILPDDLDLAILLARRLGDAGRDAERRALLARSFPALAREKRLDDLDEAALEMGEAGDAGGLIQLLAVLPSVAQQGELARARALFEVAWPPVQAAGKAGEAFSSLRALVQAMGPAGAQPFRAALLAAIEEGPARTLPDARTALAASGLADSMKPVLAALERWETIAKLAPGAAVIHGSFGAGRVRSNDGEFVVTDFERARGQRMPYAAALRTLSALPDDDLRIAKHERPQELATMRKDQPGEVLVRALRALGGEADAQKFKLFLTGTDVVPVKEWTAFWRVAKSAAESDPRIDHSRAFEQRYKLAPATAAGEEPSAEDLRLPSLSPRKNPRENLATLRKFLGQHPAAEAAVARRFGRYIEGIAQDDEGDLPDRARATLYLLRWFPERATPLQARVRALWEAGLTLNDLSGEDEQLQLLDASRSAGVLEPILLAAADARFSSVRERGESLRAQLLPEDLARMWRTLLDQAARYPQAVLRMIEDWIEGGEPALEPWRAFAAALALIEERPKPSLAHKVQGWLEAGGPFDARLAGLAPPPELRMRIGGLLRQWRSSDRMLFPALEAAERLGLAAEVEAVRAGRQRATDKMFSQVGQTAETDIPLMTRATWDRLKVELERMERELRTTVPAAIQKARELGDLRENAEYEAARHKQALLNKQVAALQLRLARARFIEDANFKDGVVGLGMEVTLESERDLVTYWILGEGEHHHGDHVISHRTPVARALMGKNIGDEVELGEGESRQRYRIVSVARRLPPEGNGQDAG